MNPIEYNGMANFYTYMGWQLITDTTSLQYKLRQDAGQNFDNEGFGVINGRYVIACTSMYGNIGDGINWKLADGSILQTIIGDLKSSLDPNNNGWGHVSGNNLNVVEFVVDYNSWYPSHANPGTQGCHPEWAGQIQGYENVGNYWNGGIVNLTTPIMKVLIGTRYYNGVPMQTTYMASYQADGYLYFNDDKFFRCDIYGGNLQVWYASKDYWVATNLIVNLRAMNNDFFSGNNGSATSGNANVENAVQWAVNKATNEYISYSRTNRNLLNPNGNTYDCSSFVITAFHQAGFDVGLAYWTGDMKTYFTAAGFEWIPGSYFDSSSLIRGDILLNENSAPIDGHTNIYIGNNQDVDCGSTPCRIITHTPDCFGTWWDGVLRWPNNLWDGFKPKV